MSNDSNSSEQPWYARNIDPILGYAPGHILSDTMAEYRSEQAAEAILMRRYQNQGLETLHNVMMLVDNCSVPGYFSEPEYSVRYLSQRILDQQLEVLAKDHMGGDAQHSVAAYNRTTAANLAVIMALAKPGSTVPYLVPKYAKPWLNGLGHPSIPRAADIAGAKTSVITTSAELEQHIRDGEVSIIAICASYRGLVELETLASACALGKKHNIPVFIDDASGARLRTVGEGHPRGIDLGADLVVTSTEKYGLGGPRAAVLVGRNDLMKQVGARATTLGVEARPSVIAAIVECLEAFTPERARKMYSQWEARHRELFSYMKEVFGSPPVKLSPYGGVTIMMEDAAQIVLKRSGLQSTDLAPVDISGAIAMCLLRQYGYMTIPALHYPGASKHLSVHLGHKSSDSLLPQQIAKAIDDSLTLVASKLDNQSALEDILFGDPGLDISS